MSDYLFIQSQDPFTEVRVAKQYQLIRKLKTAGHNVTMMLVQNGVTPAHRAAKSSVFDELLQTRITVLVDEFSISQREITSQDLKNPIAIGDMRNIIDAMLVGHKVIWN